MRREDLKNWTRDMLKDRIIELEESMKCQKRDTEEFYKTAKRDIDELKAENKALKSELDIYINCLLPRATRQAGEMIQRGLWDLVTIVTNGERAEHKSLIDENTALKQRIKDLENVCDGSCFSDEEDERDKLIAKLQNQHQQDCIKINQLHVTIDTLVDKYSRLRKTAGMD